MKRFDRKSHLHFLQFLYDVLNIVIPWLKFIFFILLLAMINDKLFKDFFFKC